MPACSVHADLSRKKRLGIKYLLMLNNYETTFIKRKVFSGPTAGPVPQSLPRLVWISTSRQLPFIFFFKVASGPRNQNWVL